MTFLVNGAILCTAYMTRGPGHMLIRFPFSFAGSHPEFRAHANLCSLCIAQFSPPRAEREDHTCPLHYPNELSGTLVAIFDSAMGAQKVLDPLNASLFPH